MNKFISFLYIFTSIFLTILSYLFIDPNFIYMQRIFTNFAFSHRIIVSALYIVSVILLFLAYGLLLKQVRENKFQLGLTGKALFLVPLILFFAYPAMLSFDIFNYIATAKVLFFYHENPYIIMPIAFLGDPLLLFMHAANKVALYGPTWIFITGVPYMLGFHYFLLILANFKILVLIGYIGTLIILWKLTKNTYSLMLFAGNPLVLIETLVSGHNDIIMVFFTVSSFYFLKRKKIIASLILLLLSIFIKYATAFLIPVYIYILIRYILNKKINWQQIYVFSYMCMLTIFLLSSFREEIYPWYALWFLPFVSLCSENKILLYISLSLSFGLLLRYVPFILLGTYFGPTPVIKIMVTFIPVIFALLYISVSKLWIKK